MHKNNINNIEKSHIICYNISISGGDNMYFKRKAYNKLLEWKENYSDKYAVLLDGARRVGKSTNRKLMKDLRIYMADKIKEQIDEQVTKVRRISVECIQKVERKSVDSKLILGYTI